MKRMLTILAIVLTGSILAGSAPAQSTPTSRPGKQAGHPFQMLRSLNLTDAQKPQVKAILQQARADARSAADPQAKRQIRQAAFQKIGKDVLNDQQRATLAQMRQARIRQVFQSLNLTDDQKAQVKAIMQQARADAANAADPQAKRQIHQAAFQKIKNTILTDAQRTQLEQMRARHGQHKAASQTAS